MAALEGIYPPIPTTFIKDESLDLQALEKNLKIWKTTSLSGVVMPGSNSELPHLADEEKVDIWRVCVDVLGPAGKKLIAGTGANTTRETIYLTRKAAEQGAHAALILPPYFYKPLMTHEALIDHFMAVADSSPIDILLYNVPQFTGVDLSAHTIIELAGHPRITGIKDSSANVLKMSRVLARRPDFNVFCGSGAALLPFLSLGAVGGIMALANIAPGPLDGIYRDFQKGRIKQARQRQLELVELNTAITATYGIPGLKYAMDQLGLHGGYSRRPLMPLSPPAKNEINHLVANAGLKPLS